MSASLALNAIAAPAPNAPATLKDAYAPFFTVGAAVKETHFEGREADLILSQFNSITPENLLKWEKVHPVENEFFWEHADALVEFGTRNGLEVFGHTLIWHNQTPEWVFKDAEDLIVEGFTVRRGRKEYRNPSGDLDFTHAYTFTR